MKKVIVFFTLFLLLTATKVVWAHAYAAAGFLYTKVKVETRCSWKVCKKASKGFGGRSRYCLVTKSSCFAYSYARANPGWSTSVSVFAANGGYAGRRASDDFEEPSTDDLPPLPPLAKVEVQDAHYNEDKKELTFVLTGNALQDIMGETDEIGYFDLKLFETDSWDDLGDNLEGANILKQGRIQFSRKVDGNFEMIGEGLLKDIRGEAAFEKTISISGERDKLGIAVVNHGDSEPLLVTLNSFMTTPLEDRILIEWETRTEPDSLGFNLWRGVPTDEGCTQNMENYTDITLLNKPDDAPRLFANDGSTISGERYFHIDYNVMPDTTYCYLLQDVNSDGTTVEYWDYISSTIVTSQENSRN